MLRSPISLSENIILENQLCAENIIENYHSAYQIDVSRFFENVKNVSVYKCLDTGLRFYDSKVLCGDSRFYKELSDRISWYYMSWKWEYEWAKKIILPDWKVLDVGCGEGFFIERLTKENINSTGLELNKDAVEKGKAKKLVIYNSSVQNHASEYGGYYDFVCSFQVMEHVQQVNDIIESSLKLLRKGGKLLISVPNNDGFIMNDKQYWLNMPPHHMLLWNREALESLPKFFKMSLDQVSIEPLQEYHLSWYYNIWLEKLRRKSNLVAKILYKVKSIHIFILKQLMSNIEGHSILAVYTKK